MWMKKDSLESKMDKGFAEVKELIESSINGLAAATAKGFARVDERFEAVDRRFDAVDERFEAIDRRFDTIDERFEGVGKQFQGINQRFDTVEFIIKDFKEETSMRFNEIEIILEDHGERLDAIEGRAVRFEKDTTNNFKTMRSEMRLYVLKNALA